MLLAKSDFNDKDEDNNPIVENINNDNSLTQKYGQKCIVFFDNALFIFWWIVMERKVSVQF